MSWHFLQGQEEASWEGNSLDGAPSALLNLIPLPGASCLHDSETESLNGSRSGTMSSPLMVSRGQEELTSSRGGSPARTSVPQEAAKGSPEQGRDSGGAWQELLMKFDHETPSWRTAQCCLFGGLEEFSGTWPAWGIMLHGECLGVNTSGCLITGKEFGLLLPTIMHNEGLAFLGGPLRSAETWMDTGRLSHRLIGLWKGWQQRENNARTGMKIACHPTFAEQLMGWPETWTDLNGSATDKYQQWLRSHGGCCHDDVSLPNH